MLEEAADHPKVVCNNGGSGDAEAEEIRQVLLKWWHQPPQPIGAQLDALVGRVGLKAALQALAGVCKDQVRFNGRKADLWWERRAQEIGSLAEGLPPLP